jgi:hypothetical protein
MTYILRESTGCCLQDAGRKIYKTKAPEKRIKKLFYDLLREAGFTEERIERIRKEIKEYGNYEGKNCEFSDDEAYVDFDDVYGTRTYLNVVE